MTEMTDVTWGDTSTLWPNATLSPNLTTPGTTPPGGSIPTFLFPVIAAEMVLSMVCLVISLVAYWTLPEFRNVHGRNLGSMSVCLLTAYALLTFDLLLRRQVSHGVCLSVAVGVHLSFLATFFWTNVMAFDVYRTFADLQPKSEVPRRSRRYLKYSVYAWLATVLAALPAFVAEWRGKDVSVNLRPLFGKRRCWVSGTNAFLLYFNAPVGLTLFINLVLFLGTVRKLRHLQQQTSILPPEQQRKQFRLYLKLFLLMGITWLSEFLPWATGVRSLYLVAGMLTALHGVFLFAIFVAKPRLLRQLWQRCTGVGPRKASHSLPTLSTSANSRV